MKKSIAVDLDGTIAEYKPGYAQRKYIGEPIEPIFSIIKSLDGRGHTIKIFTARANDPSHIPSIKKWLKKHGLGHIEVTNKKTPDMELFLDDRALQVEKNTGRILGKHKLFTESYFSSEETNNTLQGGEVMSSELYGKIFGESTDGEYDYEGKTAGVSGRYKVGGIRDEEKPADRPKKPISKGPENMKNMSAQGGDDGDLAGDPSERDPEGQMQTIKSKAGMVDGPDDMKDPKESGQYAQAGGTRHPSKLKKDTPSGMFEGDLYERIFGSPSDYVEESYDEYDDYDYDYVEEGYEDDDYDDYIEEGGASVSLYDQLFGE